MGCACACLQQKEQYVCGVVYVCMCCAYYCPILFFLFMLESVEVLVWNLDTNTQNFQHFPLSHPLKIVGKMSSEQVEVAQHILSEYSHSHPTSPPQSPPFSPSTEPSVSDIMETLSALQHQQQTMQATLNAVVASVGTHPVEPKRRGSNRQQHSTILESLSALQSQITDLQQTAADQQTAVSEVEEGVSDKLQIVMVSLKDLQDSFKHFRSSVSTALFASSSDSAHPHPQSPSPSSSPPSSPSFCHHDAQQSHFSHHRPEYHSRSESVFSFTPEHHHYCSSHHSSSSATPSSPPPKRTKLSDVKKILAGLLEHLPAD